MRRRVFLAGALASAVIPGAASASGVKISADVAVIGAGIAGLAAAAAAKEAGAGRVAVFEKGPLIGGHSVYSSGSLTAVSPKRAKVPDRAEAVRSYVADSAKVGGRVNEAVLRHTAEESESALDWLEAMGVRFAPRVFQAVGDVRQRSFSAQGMAAGREYVMKLARHLQKLGVPVQLSHRAVKLVRDEAAGVWVLTVRNTEGRQTEVRARRVIIASGGFTADVERRMKYDSRLDGTFTTSANPYGLYFDGAEGDGLDLAEAAGAELGNLSSMQYLAYAGGRLLEYPGADIYVNADGERFTAEDALVSSTAEAIFALPERRMWVITDSRSDKGATLGLKLALGTVKKAGSVAEMAQTMQVPAAALQRTLERYNGFVLEGRDRDFNKQVMLQTIEKPPFYFGEEHLSVHTTLGGIQIDARARVLKKGGMPLSGLYAAGECTGIFGRNRLGGMLLMSSLVMGRTAGREAAAGL